MDSQTLVEDRIAAGEHLLRALDQRKLRIEGAAWVRKPDGGAYELILDIPAVKSSGRTQVYREIQEAISKTTGPLALSDIVVVTPDHPLLKSLSAAISTGPGVARIRIQNSMFNGLHVDDALIYRLPGRTRARVLEKPRVRVVKGRPKRR